MKSLSTDPKKICGYARVNGLSMYYEIEGTGDPSGPYGLGVVRLDDATDPNSLSLEDPVIKAQTRFRYHVASMPIAIHP